MDELSAARAEPGNLRFEWSRSIDDPDTFVLVEAFADDEAAGAHVNSGQIVSRKVDGSDWDEMGEITIA